MYAFSHSRSQLLAYHSDNKRKKRSVYFFTKYMLNKNYHFQVPLLQVSAPCYTSISIALMLSLECLYLQS